MASADIARLLVVDGDAALRQHLCTKLEQDGYDVSAVSNGERALELAARCIPVREAGGDFYDWHQTASGQLTLTFGDVLDRGMAAAPLMTRVRTVLRAVGHQLGPAETVRMIAAALNGDLTRLGAFVTLFHAQLDLTTGRLTCVDAGHSYVVLRRASGAIEDLPSWGLPLGVQDGGICDEASLTFDPGDVLVVYSDGLTEARPDLFAKREAVADHLSGLMTADATARALIDLGLSAGPPPDSLSVAVLRRTT